MLAIGKQTFDAGTATGKHTFDGGGTRPTSGGRNKFEWTVRRGQQRHFFDFFFFFNSRVDTIFKSISIQFCVSLDCSFGGKDESNSGLFLQM